MPVIKAINAEKARILGFTPDELYAIEVVCPCCGAREAQLRDIYPLLELLREPVQHVCSRCRRTYALTWEG